MHHFPNTVSFTGALACVALLAGVPDAIAQTEAPPQLTALATPNAFQATWTGLAGRLYFIECSTDLQTWTYAPEVNLGTGTVILYGFSSTTAQTYMRLRYSTATNITAGAGGDFDGDGIPNLQEITVHGYDPTVHDDPDADGVYTAVENAEGTQPGSADTDGDGMSDGAERAAGKNPRIYDHPENKLGIFSGAWEGLATDMPTAQCPDNSLRPLIVSSR